MKTDSQIQADVIQELKWDASVNHEHIGVAVSDGIVTLSGMVPTYIERSAAEAAAQRVAGVKAVVEKIDVKLPESYARTDQDIAKAVLSAFSWHVQIPERSLKVSIEDGWVTIDGEVEWDYQKSAIDNAVRNLFGVKGVFNNIVIKPKIQPEEIKAKIEEALRRSAQQEAEQIEVDVRGSSVTLRGNVHSFADLKMAKGAAWSAPGVTTVIDNLRIAA